MMKVNVTVMVPPQVDFALTLFLLSPAIHPAVIINNQGCIMHEELKSMRLKRVGNVANVVCEVANSISNLANNVCHVARAVCNVTITICNVASDVCDVTNLICDVANVV